MSKSGLQRPAISIDIENAVILIHKSSLRLIGEPEYIQVLVNPNEKTIAVCRSFEKDHLAHRVDFKSIVGKRSYKLYSRNLTDSLHTIYPNWNSGKTYRIYGNYIPALNVIKFCLKNSVAITERNL